MITEQDLQAAIAECQDERNPNANTCIKLAAFYTIRNEMHKAPEPVLPSYSYSPSGIEYSSDSDFGRTVYGKDENSVFRILDELMEAVQVLNPRLYASVLRKLQ